MKTTMQDWFDITNIDHLKAYRQLQKTGCWPEGFVPEDVTCQGMWQIILTGKMSALYVEEKLAAAEIESKTVRYDMLDPIQNAAGWEMIFDKLNIGKH